MALVVATIDPELGTEATTAFRSYFEHPGTLTVTITPKQPLPLLQLMAMAKSSPEALPALLKISVTATP